MKKFIIYKINYNDKQTKIYKYLKDFYNDYVNITNDMRTYNNFRYIISKELYDKPKHNIKVKSIEIFDYLNFIKPYIEEYKNYKNVANSTYTNSNLFLNKFYQVAKLKEEQNGNVLVK